MSPTTALDVTIQAQVLEVLERIQERTNSAIVLITHDLGVVAGVADRVMVMYAGRPVEMSVVDEIFYHPRHPYTIGLMASLPRLDAAGSRSERLYRIKGQPPSLIFVPSGCPFHPRCEFAQLADPCATDRPTLELVAHTYGRHLAACHFRAEMADVDVEELHADVGAELEAGEDASTLSAAEHEALERLTVPAKEET
jgi:oligopeptide/dipeptide ABC transporter ATP-binding protein